jgi:hypothetical protein
LKLLTKKTPKQLTLDVKQQPRADPCPMKVIVGETSPQPEETNTQVSENTTNRPNYGFYRKILQKKNVEIESLLMTFSSTHIVFSLDKVNGSEDEL